MALFGLVACLAGAVATVVGGLPLWYLVLFGVPGLVALLDLVIIARRRSRGE